MLVSVCIPVTKTKFLETSINSALSQTYFDIEIIILNNASSGIIKNEISQIVNNYSDTRIKYYINSKQIDMVDNFNKAVSYASGELFSVLSDDDKWKPQFIEEMVSLSKKFTKVNVFHSRVMVENGIDNYEITPLKSEFEDTLDFIYNRVRGSHSFYLSDFVVRLSSLKSVGGFIDPGSGWGLDDITWFNVASTGLGVAYSSHPNMIYLNHSENVSSEFPLIKLKSFKKYIHLTNEVVSKVEIKNVIDEIKVRQIKNVLLSYEDRKSVELIKMYFIIKNTPNALVKIAVIIFKVFLKITNR